MQKSVRRMAAFILTAVIGGAAGVGAQQAFAGIDTNAVKPAISADLGAKRIVVKRGETPTYMYTPDWHQLTTQKLTIPAKQKGMITARFFGSVNCQAPSFCAMRMFVDGKRMYPATDHYGAYILPNGSLWSNESMEATYGGLGPGEHQVKVEFLAEGAATNWSLSLEYWRQS